MRRRVEYEPRQMLAGSDMRRVMTLLLLLLLVGMLMTRARDPRMWAMFANDEEAQQTAADLVKPEAEAPASQNPPAGKPGQMALVNQPALADSLDAAEPVPPPEYADEPSDNPPATPEAGTAPSTVPNKISPPEDTPSDTEEPLLSEPINAGEIPRVELPPLDEDEEEREALNEEMSVVTDNQPMLREEMAAYYRLFRWAMSQSYKQLAAKAEKDPRFGDIFTQPDKYRGKLVDLRLHVRRVLLYDDLEENNPAELEKLWEIVGYNDSSGHNFYMCITDKVPAKMPVGPKVMAEGRFVGYFLKLMKYEDGQGKMRAIPVFIGRFDWEPTIPQGPDPEQQVREWTWVMLGGAAIGVFMLIRWGLRKMSPKPAAPSRPNLGIELDRRRRSLNDETGAPAPNIEDWLENTQNATPGINAGSFDENLGESDDFGDDEEEESDDPDDDPYRRRDGFSY